MEQRTTYNTRFPYTTLFRSVRRFANGREVNEVRSSIDRADEGNHVRIGAGLLEVGALGRGLEVGELLRACRRSAQGEDRKSTRLNSSHLVISYAVFCLKNNR